MKRIISIGVLSIITFYNVNAQKLKGSDTVLPLAQKEAEAYMKKNKAARITVTGGGSGVGISALLENTTDIAMASRKMKLSEKMKITESKRSVVETVVAYDALAVIVNPANAVSQLTREQLEGIFTGKIKNWKDLGGENMPIVVYGRESSSGTYDFFKEHVLNNKNYAPSVMSMPATGAIVQSVSQTKGAIGYVGLAYVETNVKALKVSFDKGKKYIVPTVATAKDKSYPIARPLFFYYVASSAKMVKPFVDFILSPEGQRIVEQEGFITLK
jgi:phosphate transport system substrate-binding protein